MIIVQSFTAKNGGGLWHWLAFSILSCLSSISHDTNMEENETIVKLLVVNCECSVWLDTVQMFLLNSGNDPFLVSSA